MGVIAKEQVAEQLLGVKALLREDFDGGHAYDVLCKVRTGVGEQIFLHNAKVNLLLIFLSSSATLLASVTVRWWPLVQEFIFSKVDICLR